MRAAKKRTVAEQRALWRKYNKAYRDRKRAQAAKSRKGRKAKVVAVTA
jgi:hypothetical protein